MDESPPTNVRAMPVKIVAAHVSNNQTDADSVAPLLRAVVRSLTAASSRDDRPPPRPPVAAVPIRKLVFPGHVVCLEDGRRLKALKRHLQIAYGMTPKEYRARWGLPASYPMVAPDYARQRSELARRIGLGTSNRRGQPEFVASTD
jgi:predicted transcriptional regulator